MKVPFYKPALPPYELVEPEFQDAYQSGMLAPGKYTERLVEAIKEELDVKYAIPFSNCSDGLICLAGYMKTITKKTDIIIPNFTFAATWQAVEWNGMRSIVCDVDNNGLLDPKKVEIYLSGGGHRNVAAILAVHTFGQPAYIEELEELAVKYQVHLIFDAAHGFGSLYNDMPLGNSGLAEVFSIGTTKTLSAGEGGIITTNEKQLAEAMYRASMHGHKYGSLDVELPSLNGRIQEINSIIGFHALNRLEDTITERQQLADYYCKNLQNSILTPIQPREGIRSSYKDFACVVNPEIVERNIVATTLEEKGIATKKYYYPSIKDLFINKAKEEYGDNYMILSSFEVGDDLAKNCLSLPFFNGMTIDQQDYVIECILDWGMVI